MIGILFMQRMMGSSEPPRVFTDFWTSAYEAMEWAVLKYGWEQRLCYNPDLTAGG